MMVSAQPVTADVSLLISLLPSRSLESFCSLIPFLPNVHTVYSFLLVFVHVQKTHDMALEPLRSRFVEVSPSPGHTTYMYKITLIITVCLS